jgi:hypothetical protein
MKTITAVYKDYTTKTFTVQCLIGGTFRNASFMRPVRFIVPKGLSDVEKLYLEMYTSELVHIGED